MAQTATGSIQGTVADARNNKPVAGAFVTAIRAGLPPFSQTAQTGADGSYELRSLPVGAYSVCVQVAGDGYLDPCQFGGTAQLINLSTGQQFTGSITKLKPASVLKIRLNDAGGLLAQTTKDGHEPDLLIGVFGSGPQRTFYPAHLAARDKAGSDYQVAVPLDTPLNLSAASNSLNLADATAPRYPITPASNGFSTRPAIPTRRASRSR